MNIANEKTILDLGRKILDYENHTDWKIRIGIDTECVYELKEIIISERELNQPIYYIFESIIHEVAHVNRGRSEFGHGHDSKFFEEMAILLIKYKYLMSDDNER